MANQNTKNTIMVYQVISPPAPLGRFNHHDRLEPAKSSRSMIIYIHRTRIGFENDGYDSFTNMALKGIRIADHVVIND